jgi:hypothetical protein
MSVSVFFYVLYAILYWHLWPVWLCKIFPRYLTNSKIFGIKVIHQKMCFFLQLSSEKFLTLRRIPTDIINLRKTLCKGPVTLLIF